MFKHLPTLSPPHSAVSLLRVGHVKTSGAVATFTIITLSGKVVVVSIFKERERVTYAQC